MFLPQFWEGSTHHLPNVFSCTLIQLCSSTAMANTHARWVRWAVSSSRSAGELLEGFLPLACLLANRHVSRRRLMQILNQSAPKVDGKAIMTSSGKGSVWVFAVWCLPPLIRSTESGLAICSRGEVDFGRPAKTWRAPSLSLCLATNWGKGLASLRQSHSTDVI